MEERAGCFLYLSSWCLVTVSVLWPFLTTLVCDVVFPGHTRLLFAHIAVLLNWEKSDLGPHNFVPLSQGGPM